MLVKVLNHAKKKFLKNINHSLSKDIKEPKNKEMGIVIMLGVLEAMVDFKNLNFFPVLIP